MKPLKAWAIAEKKSKVILIGTITISAFQIDQTLRDYRKSYCKKCDAFEIIQVEIKPVGKNK